jgi:hypothetical protein
MITETTAIIYNDANDGYHCNYLQSPDLPILYRWRNCDTNLTSNTPEAQYQRQKIIQNTVRVPSSLYTMNLGSLSGYQNANHDTEFGVCWNQMSDRIHPHVQKNVTASGSSYGGNSTKRSILRLRPGAMSPGGKGVDIKHNSYDRRLNRLKGQSILRRGSVPKNFGAPIVFNPAFPVYGGKTMKTSIVAGCDCPIVPSLTADEKLNVDPYPNNIYNVQYFYSPGQKVFVIEYDEKTGDPFLYNGIIVSQVNENTYNVELENGLVNAYNVLRILPQNAKGCGNGDAGCENQYDADGKVFSNIYNILKNNVNNCHPNVLIYSLIQKDINDILNSGFESTPLDVDPLF